MYYPFLRGKQFELIALREFSGENVGQKNIVPVIEPVRNSLGQLSLTISELLKCKSSFALILNPCRGDYSHPTIKFDALNKIGVLLENKDMWMPAFIYQHGAASHILDMVSEYGFKDTMIIFPTCVSMDDEEAWDLINNENVHYVLNSFGSSIARRLKNQLFETGKKIVRLDDCFKRQSTNENYAYAVDELFSEEFYYYREDGFSGFSDYTLLPGEFIEGGMLPKVVAIHLSYQKEEDQIYVHHFLSDSKNGKNDIKNEFVEAAQKVEPFWSEYARTSAINELIFRAHDESYPGLGYLKKLSIKNHLELVSKIAK